MNYDVVVLTETWLNSNILSSELFDDRYEVYRRDRVTTGFHNNKDGGGVLIAVSKKFNSKCIDSWQSNCEDMWVTVDCSTSHSSHQVAFCAVYLPPPVCLRVFEQFIEHCNAVLDSTNIPICIMGDFNLGIINWDDLGNVNVPMPSVCQRLIEFIDTNKLIQHNNIKNCSGRMLDLILSTELNLGVTESCYPLVNIDKLHPPLDLLLSFVKANNLPYNKLNIRPNFYRADYDRITETLNKHNWCDLFRGKDVNEMLVVFYDVLNGIINDHIPKYKTPNSKYPPWFNKTFVRLLKEKNKLRLRYRKYGNPLDEIELRLLAKRSQVLAKELYNGYIKDLEANIKENPKLFWSYVKTKRGGSSSYPLTMTDGQTIKTSNGPTICDLFANYFSSSYTADNGAGGGSDSEFLQSLFSNGLCLESPVVTRDCLLKKLKALNVTKGAGPDGIPPIFISACASALVWPLQIIYNTSLTSGIFPVQWKLAKVVPVYKSNKKDIVSNYRPISILSTFAKIFESIICPYIQDHLRLYISDYQHGFVAMRSTATNLLTFTESVTCALDKNTQFDVIYTDFSKAFDRISHSVLIHKLSAYGVTGTLLEWLKSYLTGRQFYVVVNGFESEKYCITSGVPQGSHLAPILFNLFINDLPSCFRFSECYLYADDLKIARKVESLCDAELLQDDLNRLHLWCNNNGLQLNIMKCHHIKFTRKTSSCVRTDYFIDSHKVQEVDELRDLGVIFDKKVTFVSHVDNVVGRASKMLGFVLRNTKGFKNSATKVILYNSLVRSVLEYCSVVWRPHYATHSLRLERVQKRFLWHLAFSTGKAKQLPSYITRLRYFGMLSLATRRDIADSTFIYKLLTNKVDCPQLLSLIRFNAPSRYPKRAITPLCPPLRRTVLGANSPISRLCKILNSYSDLVDIQVDSKQKFLSTVVDFLKSKY